MHDAVAYLIYFPLILSPIALLHFLLDLPWVLNSPIHPSLSPLLYIYVFSRRQHSRGNAFNSVCVCVCVCWKHFFSQFWWLVGLFLDSKCIPSVEFVHLTLTRLLLRLHDFVIWWSTVLANCFQEPSNLCFFQESVCVCVCVCVCTCTHYK